MRYTPDPDGLDQDTWCLLCSLRLCDVRVQVPLVQLSQVVRVLLPPTPPHTQVSGLEILTKT